MTTHSQKDLGTIMAVLNRLNNERLPRALAIKRSVDAGGALDPVDAVFIQQAMDEASSLGTLVERNPEYKELVERMAALYTDITTKGLQNAQNAGRKSS